MKIAKNIPYFIIAGFIYLLIYSSCARTGIPTGGPKDSIPPILIRTEPQYGELNFEGDEIRFTFDEYILIDKVNEFLVVSPPLERRPTVRMKAKTIILQFDEELPDSTTFSIDLKNAIEDNNEKNPYNNLRLSFSTWDVFDSLRVAGVIKNASNLKPFSNTLVMLHKNLNDTAIFNLVPDYIAKTDEKGFFLFDNLAPGNYHIFSINDVNSDLKYNEGSEEIAFIDTLIIPTAQFIEQPDTLISGADSMLISGHTQFSPEPIYMLQFMQDVFSQFLTSATRESKYQCHFIFEESVKDTFNVELLNSEAENWYLLEPNPTLDSITLWIADTTIANIDTLNLELSYNQIDSAGVIYLLKDTLSLIHTEVEKEPVRRRRRNDNEEELIKVEQFSISDNLKNIGFDINIPIVLKIPQPEKYFNQDQVHLYLASDTTGTPLNFTLEKDTTSWRTYKISYEWEGDTQYRLEIDSAACENIYGVTNRNLIKNFKTQKDDYYGSILLETKNVNGAIIIQLLKATENEEFIKSKTIENDGLVIFEYLPPGKYILKAIYDNNKNGKWDTGNFKNHTQPEKVNYLQKMIKVRSHFDHQEPWDLTPDPTFQKDIFDPDAVEKTNQ